MKQSQRDELKSLREKNVSQLARMAVRNAMKERLGHTIDDWTEADLPWGLAPEQRTEFKERVVDEVVDHYVADMGNESHPLNDANESALMWAERALPRVNQLVEKIDSSDKPDDIWTDLTMARREALESDESLPGVDAAMEREFPYTYRDPAEVMSRFTDPSSELQFSEGLAEIVAPTLTGEGALDAARIRNPNGEYDLIGTFSTSQACDADGNSLDPVMDNVVAQFGYVVRRASKSVLDETLEEHPDGAYDPNWESLIDELQDDVSLSIDTRLAAGGIDTCFALPTATAHICEGVSVADDGICHNLVRPPETLCWLHSWVDTENYDIVHPANLGEGFVGDVGEGGRICGAQTATGAPCQNPISASASACHLHS